MFRSLLAICLSVLLAGVPVFGAPADVPSAGEVKALMPAASRNAQPVKVKDALAWNDLLHTDAKGRLRAGLTDGSILSLGANSELRVVQHDTTSQQTSLEMNYGKLRNQVVKITQPGGKYEVKTPNAVIGVIGTDFYVGYGNNQTTVICYVGKVAVTPSGGAKVVKSDTGNGTSNTITLTAGQMVVIGLEILPSGYQPSSTPTAVARESVQDTNVPDQIPVIAKAHPHLVRNLVIGIGAAAAGWAIGVTQLKTNPSQRCNPQSGKCG